MKTIQIIDTHTHLYDKAFTIDRANLLIESRAMGIIGIVSVSESLADAEVNQKLTRIHPEILPAAGLYPAIIDRKEAEAVERFIIDHQEKLVGIGEVGLDFWVVKEDEEKAIQQDIFSMFIDLSIETELPLNVHSRSAGHHAIELLLRRNAKNVQMHAFDGKASYALQAVEAGYFFSIPPSLVRSRQKQKLVKKLPLSSILLETDSPVLGPQPEERNTPLNIAVAAEAIAEIKSTPVEKVYETVLENTFRLYGHTKVMKGLRKRISSFSPEA